MTKKQILLIFLTLILLFCDYFFFNLGLALLCMQPLALRLPNQQGYTSAAPDPFSGCFAPFPHLLLLFSIIVIIGGMGVSIWRGRKKS